MQAGIFRLPLRQAIIKAIDGWCRTFPSTFIGEPGTLARAELYDRIMEAIPEGLPVILEPASRDEAVTETLRLRRKWSLTGEEVFPAADKENTDRMDARAGTADSVAENHLIRIEALEAKLHELALENEGLANRLGMNYQELRDRVASFGSRLTETELANEMLGDRLEEAATAEAHDALADQVGRLDHQVTELANWKQIACRYLEGLELVHHQLANAVARDHIETNERLDRQAQAIAGLQAGAVGHRHEATFVVGPQLTATTLNLGEVVRDA